MSSAAFGASERDRTQSAPSYNAATGSSATSPQMTGYDEKRSHPSHVPSPYGHSHGSHHQHHGSGTSTLRSPGHASAAGDLTPSASMPASLDAMARPSLSAETSEKRSNSAQGHHSEQREGGRQMPASGSGKLQPSDRRKAERESDKERERPTSPERDRKSGDELNRNGTSSTSSTRLQASNVSGPMNAVPLPKDYVFKQPNRNDRMKKTKSSFWNFGSKAGKTSCSDLTATIWIDLKLDSAAGDKPAAVEAPAQPSRPVFGVPLKEAVAASRIRPGLELPAVVYRCVEYLEAKNAECEEGIFRLSGSANVIRMLKDRFNAEGDVNLLGLNEYVDPHAVAGLLKSFLRELPGHILTRELHGEFIQVIGEHSSDLVLSNVGAAELTDMCRPEKSPRQSQRAGSSRRTVAYRGVHALPFLVSTHQFAVTSLASTLTGLDIFCSFARMLQKD